MKPTPKKRVQTQPSALSGSKPIKTKNSDTKTKTSNIKKTIPKPSSARKIEPERISQQPTELITEDSPNWYQFPTKKFLGSLV